MMRARDDEDSISTRLRTRRYQPDPRSVFQVTFMYMNSTIFEFNKMSTVATTILTSFAAAGIVVNHVRSWSEPYYATHMKNPFHEHVRETYRETRSE